TAAGRDGDAAGLDLAEADAHRALGDRAVGFAERSTLGQRAEGGLPQQQVRAVPARRALDGVDHRDAAFTQPSVQLVDVEDPRRQVVEVRAARPADVRGD